MFDGNCDIQVELDPPDKVEFTSDETISGTVTVQVSDDVTCDGLNIELGWKTDGRGNQAGQKVLVDTLYTGEWLAGETYEYEFEIPLPEGPFTYHGSVLNVDWELTATADIPWALDPSDSVDFVLKPGVVSNPVIGETSIAEYLEGETGDEPTIKWVTFIFGLVFGGVGVFLLTLTPTVDQVLMPLLIGLAFCGFGGWMTYHGVKNFFAERKLGDVDVDLSTLRVSPTEQLDCSVQLSPSGNVELNAVNITLEGQEKVVYGHGTDKNTYRQRIHSEAVVADDSIETTLSGGSPVTFQESVRIPEGAPFTFEAPDNQLFWKVKVHVDVPGWPDWEHEQRIMVLPGGQTSEQRALDRSEAETATQRPAAGDEPETGIESGDGADVKW